MVLSNRSTMSSTKYLTTPNRHTNLSKTSPISLSSVPSPSPQKPPTNGSEATSNVTAISNSLFKEHLHRHEHTNLLKEFNKILAENKQPVITSRTQLRQLLHLSQLFKKGVSNNRSYLELLVEKRFLDENQLNDLRKQLKEQQEKANTSDESNLQAKLEEQTMKLKHERMKYNDLNKEHLQLLSKLEAVNQQVHELNGEIFMLKRKQKGTDEEESTNLQNRITELEEKISQKESKLEELRERSSSLESVNDTLKEKLRSLEESIADKEHTIEDLQSQQQDSSELDALRSQLEEKEEAINQLKEEIDTLNQRIPDLESETNTLKSQLEERDEELRSLRMEMEDQNEYASELQASLRSKESELDELRTSTEALAGTREVEESSPTDSGEVEELKSQIEELKDEIDFLKSEHTRELDTLRKEHEDQQGAATKVEPMQHDDDAQGDSLVENNVDELNDRIDSLQSEVNEWRNKYEELQDEFESAHNTNDAELQSLRDQTEEWRSKYEQLSEKQEDAADTAHMMNSLKESLKERDGRIGELEAKLRDMTAEIATADTEQMRKDFQQNLEEKTELLKEQEARIHHLKKKNAKLKSDRKKLQEYVAELEKELEEYEDEERDD